MGTCPNAELDRTSGNHLEASKFGTFQPPIDRHRLLNVEETPTQAKSTKPAATDTDSLLLHNSHQFYKWHSELEAAMGKETEQKYLQYAESLEGHLQTCDQILAQVMPTASWIVKLQISKPVHVVQVDGALEKFETLQTQHRAVDVKTRALHDSCERLVVEKERLVEFADALRSKLDYFDELDRIAGGNVLLQTFLNP
eukprot:1187943-Prorocentrum_minimum.AAC.4